MNKNRLESASVCLHDAWTPLLDTRAVKGYCVCPRPWDPNQPPELTPAMVADFLKRTIPRIFSMGQMKHGRVSVFPSNTLCRCDPETRLAGGLDGHSICCVQRQPVAWDTWPLLQYGL